MSRYAKTAVAVLVAALTALQAAISDGHVTNNEWIIIALAAIGAAGVYAIPNTPPAGQPADPNISEQGYGIVETVVGVLLILILVFLLLRVVGH